jgi:ribosome-binding factor A
MNWRSDKLKSMFLEELNMVISKREDLKEIAFFTITDVELIDEGKILNVYFSVYDTKERQNEKIEILTAKLNEISNEIKGKIRKRIRTKFVPNIVFKYDNTPDRASRIEEIFKKINSKHSY